MNATLVVIFMAVLLDRWLGEPEWLFDRLPHPVVLIGRAITWLEAWLYPLSQKCLAGIGLVFVILSGSIALGLFLAQFWIVELFLIAVLLAQKSLLDHVDAVARGLTVSLEQGRFAVAKIVGRDTAMLDRSGVARAANESLAENLADGVVAPLFWLLIFGLPGLLAYKALNTLDSMVGYNNRRYAAFGWASARLDDLANWLPARLTGLLYCLVGALAGRRRFAESYAIMQRCAPKHRSPNAGWPESALAAILDFKLAGPRHYAHGKVEDAWMGEGRVKLDVDDIEEALRLTRSLLNWLTGLLGLAALLSLG